MTKRSTTPAKNDPLLLAVIELLDKARKPFPACPYVSIPEPYVEVLAQEVRTRTSKADAGKAAPPKARKPRAKK